MSAIEQNTCAFCGESKPVSRKYLYRKNTGKPFVSTFIYIYFCEECGITDDIPPAQFLENSDEEVGQKPKNDDIEFFWGKQYNLPISKEYQKW